MLLIVSYVCQCWFSADPENNFWCWRTLWCRLRTDVFGKKDSSKSKASRPWTDQETLHLLEVSGLYACEGAVFFFHLFVHGNGSTMINVIMWSILAQSLALSLWEYCVVFSGFGNNLGLGQAIKENFSPKLSKMANVSFVHHHSLTVLDTSGIALKSWLFDWISPLKDSMKRSSVILLLGNCDVLVFFFYSMEALFRSWLAVKIGYFIVSNLCLTFPACFLGFDSPGSWNA